MKSLTIKIYIYIYISTGQFAGVNSFSASTWTRGPAARGLRGGCAGVARRTVGRSGAALGAAPAPGCHRRKQHVPGSATSTHGVESFAFEGSRLPSGQGRPEDRRCPKRLFPGTGLALGLGLGLGGWGGRSSRSDGDGGGVGFLPASPKVDFSSGFEAQANPVRLKDE